MKRLYIYTILATLLAACSNNAPDAPGQDGNGTYEMRFKALTGGLTRASSTGIYDSEIYPVNRLYLTAFLIDNCNERQYYFTDMLLSYDETTGEWYAPGWYWPIQGEMSFLSYWCPGFSRAPVFDEMVDVDGNRLPRMMVDASDLDGKTDFIYLSQAGVKCPQSSTNKLLFTHGLTWITITMRAEVLDAGANGIDSQKTNDLINHLRVNKVILEDCSRKGFASIVPGNGVNWKTYNDAVDPVVSYVRDQVYYYPGGTTSEYLSPFQWEEMEDGSTFTPAHSLPALKTTPQTLGVYGQPTATNIYEGLLIIPQNKTAITVDYTVIDINNNEVHKVERYELRDNSVSWLPGYHYSYDIVFRNYNDYSKNFDVIPTWSGVYVRSGNYCYDNSYGVLNPANNPAMQNGFAIEPVHSGGSGMGDDMDYIQGGRVF